MLDGTADMAWVNPSLTPELFADVAVMQLPGLFRDLKEATMVYTSLMRYGEIERLRKILRDRFIRQFSIDDPYALAFRLPCRLAGKENPGKQPRRGRDTGDFGIELVVLPVNEIARAMGRGTIEGTTMPSNSLFAYGISRITKYHYVGHFGAAPLNFLMNRETFDNLPIAGRDAIQKHNSGDWAAARFIENLRCQQRLWRWPSCFPTPGGK